MKKRFLSILLTLCMVLSLVPVTAFAEENVEVEVISEKNAGDTPVCICETACTAEGMNADCPVCGAGGAIAKNCGKCGVEEPKEEPQEEQKEEQKEKQQQEEKKEEPQEEQPKEERKEEGAAAEKKPGDAATLQTPEGEDALRPVVYAEHTHCICGGNTDVGDHTSHSDVTFTPWNGTDAITYMDGKAYVYLTADVTSNSDLNVNGKTLYLCLNGKEYTNADRNKISVAHGGQLVLCDCKGSGIVKKASDQCINIYENSTVDIFGGKITIGAAGNENNNFGAVILDDSTSVLNLYGGEISGNKGYQYGGAIFLHDRDGKGGKANLYGGTISGNSANVGGAIYIENGGTVTFSGTNITDNEAERGGAIYMNKGGTVELKSGTLDGNKAQVDGGAIYVNDGGSVTLSGGTIRENKASEQGGAVFLQNGGNVTLSGTEVTGNKAYKGGAIYANQGGMIELSGSTVKDNQADWDGGGIYLTDNTTVNFNNGTVTGNRARWGGGFYLFGGGTLNLNGGSLTGNIAENTTDDGRLSAGGGVYSDKGNITLSGTAVTGNKAEWGGGFHVTADTKLTIAGGSISANQATLGSGAYLDSAGTIIAKGSTVADTIYNEGTIEPNAENTAETDFQGEVTNSGTISGGIFSGAVINSGTISGGIFSNTVTNKNTIENGTFNGKVICAGSAADGNTSGPLSGGVIKGGTYTQPIEMKAGTVYTDAKLTVVDGSHLLTYMLDGVVYLRQVLDDTVWPTQKTAPKKTDAYFEGWYYADGTRLTYRTGISADGTVTARYNSSYDGTEERPVPISSVEDLYLFWENVNQYGEVSLCAKLMNDIVLNEGTFDADGNYSNGTATEWTPIGTDAAPYTGTFDGAGHTIQGLYTNSGDDYQGLFAKLENATVKDLTVTGYIEGDDYVGAVAGKAIGTTCILNCRSEGVIKGDDNIGGIVGESYGTTSIRGCYNASAVSGDEDIGGIAGDANDSTMIENCYNAGAITSEDDDDDIGGIAGVTYNNVIIRNCDNTGTVSGDEDIGGIVGDVNDSGIVENCYNTGEVSGDEDIGGVAGETPTAGGIQDCYNLGEVTGNSHTGGVVGQHRGEMKFCYNMGTVSATGGENEYGAIAGYVYGDDYDEHYGGKMKDCYYLNGTAVKGIGTNDNSVESEVETPTPYDTTAFADGTVLNLLIAGRTGDENPWDTEGCKPLTDAEEDTTELPVLAWQKLAARHHGGEATCKDKAVCSGCGKEYGSLDTQNHTHLQHISAKAATKTAEGNIEYWYCDGCGKYYSDETTTKEITKDATIVAKLTEKPADPKPADTKPNDTKPSGTKTNHSKSTDSSPKTSGKSPETGDTNELFLWLVLLLLSSGIGAGVVSRKKKYNR